ncbi:MAG TPA: hypothetical protein VF881_07675 [Polyangiaceae bacterium]
MRWPKLRKSTYPERSAEAPIAWTAGERAMTETLFRHHASFVANFLTRLGVAPSRLDEGVSRVFAEVHRRGACPPNAATPVAWLGAIALRSVASRDAAAGRRGPAIETAADGALPSFREFLRTLDLELRAIFVLFELEAENSESIAAAFTLPLDRVRERIREGQYEYRRAHGALEPAAGPVSEPSEDECALPPLADPVSLV